MGQKNDNFIDKTFTVLADILLKVLPATKDEKQSVTLGLSPGPTSINME